MVEFAFPWSLGKLRTFGVCVCVCPGHNTCVDVSRLHSLGSRDWGQVARIGGRHPGPLGHVAEPKKVFTHITNLKFPPCLICFSISSTSLSMLLVTSLYRLLRVQGMLWSCTVARWRQLECDAWLCSWAGPWILICKHFMTHGLCEQSISKP